MMHTQPRPLQKDSVIADLFSWCRMSVHRFYRSFFLTKDTERHQKLIRAILGGAVIMSVIMSSCAVYRSITLGDVYEGISIPMSIGIVTLFFGIYSLARYAHRYQLASTLFLLLYYAGTVYGTYVWGADMPLGLLSYALFVAMTTAMLGNGYGIVAAFASALGIFFTGIREIANHIIPAWEHVPIAIGDLITDSILIFLAALLSWLSNREIKHSLNRAHASEKALKLERDNLEITVDRRTQALKQAHLEKAADLYRFAEFGKLSAGVFHDLINPLTAISVSINSIYPGTQSDQLLATEIKEALSIANHATKRIDSYIASVQKQLKHKTSKTLFSVVEEIENVITINTYRARREHVVIECIHPHEKVTLYGDVVRFHHVMTNLISNAIESYNDQCTENKRVCIAINTSVSVYTITVQDNGCGVSTEQLSHIFDPFFTTKPNGIGIGLAMVRAIIEEDFAGTITCTSTPLDDTTFTITLPRNNT